SARQAVPVDVMGVAIHARPAAMADVRRPEEVLRVLGYEHLLRPHGRRQPRAQPVVVVMVRGGCELLPADEPRMLAMALFLDHARQPGAKLAQAFDCRGIARSLDHERRLSSLDRYGRANAR